MKKKFDYSASFKD